jgi:CheY-like chemotaxis protein
LANAVKYTPRDGRIDVSLSRADDQAVVEIVDSGIGIPTAEVERVFDLFSQVREHQERTQGGLGIGLALLKSLVSSHEGVVRAYSEGRGKGSRFTVSLPLLPEPSGTSVAEQAAAARVRAVSRRVLVADDNQDAVATLAELLRMRGHQVWTACDGEEAVQLVRQVAPEIVILDLGMPNADGFEAARRIRALEDQQPSKIVALSGWGQNADRVRTRAAGFDYHLTKPAPMATLDEILLGRQ